MENDSVAAAFELLLEEIYGTLDDLQEQAAQYLRAGEIDQVESRLRSIKAMKEFQTKMIDSRNEWKGGGLDIEIKHPFKGDMPMPVRRSPRTALVVKLPNRKIIKESTAAETFTRAIGELGIDKVERLGKTMSNWPLISSEKHPNPSYNPQKMGNYFVMTHSSTLYKKKLLEEIARELNVSIEVSVTI